MKKVSVILSVLIAVLLLAVGVMLYKNYNITSKNAPFQKVSDWQGVWVRESSDNIWSSSLEVSNVMNSSFAFTIDAQAGGDTGNIDSIDEKETKPTAVINGNSATATIENVLGTCKLSFELKNSSAIKLTTNGCDGFAGNGVTFDGNYIKNGTIKQRLLNDILLSNGADVGHPIFKNQDEINAFKNLVGDYYAGIFINSLGPVFDDKKDLDGLGARVYYGWMAHNAIQAAIIMLAPSGKIYAAVRDYDETNNMPGILVAYFTNEANYKSAPPKTIYSWINEQKGNQQVHINYIYKP